MPAATKLFALLTVIVVAGSDAALAWERAPAPVEFANRATRHAPLPELSRTRASSDGAAPARRMASSAADQPDILYGYGRTSRGPGAAPLDLRGTLSVSSDTPMLDDDAFDAVAPSVALHVQPSAREPGEQVAVGGAPWLDVTLTEATDSTITAAVAAEASSIAGAYFVQVGAFADPANAERVRAALQDVGTVTIDQRHGHLATLHRVRLGQWPTRAAAELACDMIVERGFAGAVVAGGR
jgi:cell division septation protein DedD